MDLLLKSKATLVGAFFLISFNTAQADSKTLLNSYSTDDIARCGMISSVNYGYLLKFASSFEAADWNDKLAANDAILQTLKFARENKLNLDIAQFKSAEQVYGLQLKSVQPSQVANYYIECYRKFKPLARNLIAENRITINK